MLHCGIIGWIGRVEKRDALDSRFLTSLATWINSNRFTYTIKMKRANRVKRIYPYWKNDITRNLDRWYLRFYSSYLQPGLFDFEAYFSYSSALFSNLVRALIAVMCNFGQLKHTSGIVYSKIWFRGEKAFFISCFIPMQVKRSSSTWACGMWSESRARRPTPR